MASGLMLAILAAALLAVAPTPKPVEGPIAVLPFKNLNTDSKLDWMKLGIAETMVSDLKKAGKTRVVERDQVDRALTEVVLQNARETEDSTAAKVGKLVGAKTIVVGSYQQAGKQLRINARFVSVETGEVLDTAKTTGSAADPFALQDQIVAKLLGIRKLETTSVAPHVPTKPKSVEAYRLYAMSLSVASDADRAGYLQQSLAIDPDFVYSAEALEALKKRMGLLKAVSNKALTADQEALRAKMRDATLGGADRARAAGKLEDSLLNSRRFHALVDVASEVYDAKFPGEGLPVDPSLYAAYCRIYALHQLKEWDRALQYGESFLKQYPGGWGYDNIERLMDGILRTRVEWSQAAVAWQKHVADERAKTPELADYARCQWSERDHYAAEMAASCAAFATKYAAATDPATRARVEDATFAAFNGSTQIGKFDDARSWAKKLEGNAAYADTVDVLLKNTVPAD